MNDPSINLRHARRCYNTSDSGTDGKRWPCMIKYMHSSHLAWTLSIALMSRSNRHSNCVHVPHLILSISDPFPWIACPSTNDRAMIKWWSSRLCPVQPILMPFQSGLSCICTLQPWLFWTFLNNWTCAILNDHVRHQSWTNTFHYDLVKQWASLRDMPLCHPGIIWWLYWLIKIGPLHP